MLDVQRAASGRLWARVTDTDDQAFPFGGVENQVSADLIGRQISLPNVVQAGPLFAFRGFPPFLKPKAASRIGKLSGANRLPADDVHSLNCSMFAKCEQWEQHVYW